MISREVLLEKLQLCVDDPMWPDHVEMPKQLIRIVIEQLTRHAQRPLTQADVLKWLNENCNYFTISPRNQATLTSTPVEPTQCALRHVEALEVCKVGFQNLISLTEQTDIEIRDVCLQKIDWALCSDCPPIGYSTDKTRCDPCPRRDTALTSTVDQLGHEITAEAFRAFDRWCAEHDPDGLMELLYAAEAYSAWAETHSIEPYLDAAVSLQKGGKP